MNLIDSLTYTFFHGGRSRIGLDRIDYQPNACTWVYAGKVIAATVSQENRQLLYLCDNGKRTAPVYRRLSRILNRTQYGSLDRSGSRDKNWILRGWNAEAFEPWFGKKIFYSDSPIVSSRSQLPGIQNYLARLSRLEPRFFRGEEFPDLASVVAATESQSLADPYAEEEETEE